MLHIRVLPPLCDDSTYVKGTLKCKLARASVEDDCVVGGMTGWGTPFHFIQGHWGTTDWTIYTQQ